MRKPLTEQQKKEAILRTQEWVKLNPHKAQAYRKAYYQRNKDKIKAVSMKWATENREKANKNVADYRADKPWYGSWIGAKHRCTNPNSVNYSHYGGRGIKFNLTKEDMVFLWERDKASELDYPSLDRIDNEGDYTRENCQFIEHRENCRRESGYAKVRKQMIRLGRWTEKS